MFSNDPFQSQLSPGAYSGATNPFTSSYAGPYAGSMQTGIGQLTNPVTQGVSQFGPPFGQQAYGGVPNYATIAQQQQIVAQQQQIQEQIRQQIQQIQQLQALASILASQQSSPFQNPVSQMQPWQMQQGYGGQQNPLLAATLQNPLLAQQLQQQNPFAQSGYPLAPQSWVGQQLSPHHHQLAGRGIY